MNKEVNIVVSPEVGADMNALSAQVAHKLGISKQKLTHVEILRRSVDARRRPIR